ncbi:hypothetical protein BKA56DRAFT_618974 [Ilyonectria sp. MPI-CAGE-AT-0026]|nr:hypothetical protein BKA56DRAFT_618974 [Ilyonectria sp. MPI-CAGE-AT-0026]
MCCRGEWILWVMDGYKMMGKLSKLDTGPSRPSVFYFAETRICPPRPASRLRPPTVSPRTELLLFILHRDLSQPSSLSRNDTTSLALSPFVTDGPFLVPAHPAGTNLENPQRCQPGASDPNQGVKSQQSPQRNQRELDGMGGPIPAHCQATHENHAAENGSDLSTQPQMVSQGPALPRLHGSLERCRAAMSALTGRESLKSLQGRRSTQAQLWSLHPARLVQRSFFSLSPAFWVALLALVRRRLLFDSESVPPFFSCWSSHVRPGRWVGFQQIRLNRAPPADDTLCSSHTPGVAAVPILDSGPASSSHPARKVKKKLV